MLIFLGVGHMTSLGATGASLTSSISLFYHSPSLQPTTLSLFQSHSHSVSDNSLCSQPCLLSFPPLFFRGRGKHNANTPYPQEAEREGERGRERSQTARSHPSPSPSPYLLEPYITRPNRQNPQHSKHSVQPTQILFYLSLSLSLSPSLLLSLSLPFHQTGASMPLL